MERLRSLIKEVLSTPSKKKDCNCGCGGCDKKAPIITEGRIKKAISEGLTYHVENKIPLHESVYRIGSEKHFALINEARKLWVRGLIDVSEDDQAILETHLGNFGMYEGEEVPLDMPMVNEEKEYYVTYNKGRGQGKGLVKSKESNYEEPRVFSKEEAEEYAKEAESRSRQMTAYWVSDKDMNRLEESLNEVEIGDTVKIDKNYGGGRGVVDDKVGSYVIINGKSYHESDVKVINSINEVHKLLRQTNLSSEEYQKAKKLKGFNADDYTFSSDNNLYVKKESLKEDIYDKFLDDPQSPKGRAKAIISKFIKQYGEDASGMAVDRFAKQNNLKPEEKYILQYITKNNISISSKPGGPDFSALHEAANSGASVQWPDELDSYYGMVTFKKVNEFQNGSIAKYDIILNKTGEVLESREFQFLSNLEYMASDYALPKGGTQSSQFEESLEEATSKYPDFDLDKNIKYQDTSISSGMWRFTGKEQGGKGVYRNLMNDQFLGFSSDDFDFFKKHLGSHFDISESLDEAKKKKKSKKKDPPLNKPKRGGSKAYYVYVRDPKTKKIKKVSFGSGGLRAKIKNKQARNAFAARHNCDKKKDRTTAGYWSCNLPRYADQLGLGSKMNTFW